MERNSGYFLVWRKIWKSPVFKNLKQCAIWIYMGIKDRDVPRALMELFYLLLAIRGIYNWIV